MVTSRPYESNDMGRKTISDESEQDKELLELLVRHVPRDDLHAIALNVLAEREPEIDEDCSLDEEQQQIISEEVENMAWGIVRAWCNILWQEVASTTEPCRLSERLLPEDANDEALLAGMIHTLLDYGDIDVGRLGQIFSGFTSCLISELDEDDDVLSLPNDCVISRDENGFCLQREQ